MLAGKPSKMSKISLPKLKTEKKTKKLKPN